MQVAQGSIGTPVPRAWFSGAAPAAETAFALLGGLWRAPVGIALLDRDLRFVQVNEAFALLTGLPLDAHAGRLPRELFPGQHELVTAAEWRLRSVLESGRPALEATAASRAPGRAPRTWRANVYPMVADDGAIRGVCAMVEETTHVADRERALEIACDAASRNARRLALLQGLTAALSAAVNPADIGRAVIDRVCALAGADAVALHAVAGDALAPLACGGLSSTVPGATCTVPLSAPLPGPDALRGHAGLWLESPEAIAVRYPQVVEVARAAPLEACAVLPLRTRGRVLGTLSVGFRAPRAFDLEERALLISAAEQCAQALDRARLLADERLRRLEAERDRALLDGVIANAPLGVALLDRDLRYVRVNAVLAAIHGVTVEAHAGRSPGEFLPAAAWEEVRSGLLDVLATGRSRIDVPVVLRRADGGVRHLLAAWYPVGAGRDACGVAALVRDVTAERDAEEFQRNVLGIVGHDLRTPLTTVTTAAFLLARGDLGPAQSRHLARIASAGSRIEQLVAILSDYARASGGAGIPVRRRSCDIGAICREVADEGEGAHPGRTVRCRGEGDGSGEWDPDRIRQVLANLLTNALEHGAEDAPVEVRWAGRPDDVRIEVVNTGAAIAPDLLPRIFDAFRGARRERGGPGTGLGLGLGLFIARAIVFAHGGAIEARSVEGVTTLAVRLPRHVPRA